MMFCRLRKLLTKGTDTITKVGSSLDFDILFCHAVLFDCLPLYCSLCLITNTECTYAKNKMIALYSLRGLRAISDVTEDPWGILGL